MSVEIEGLGRRMRKISGQVQGIERMIQDGHGCSAVLLQIAAVRGALGKVAGLLLENHVRSCLLSASSGDEQEAEIQSLMTVVSQYGGLTR